MRGLNKVAIDFELVFYLNPEFPLGEANWQMIHVKLLLRIIDWLHSCKPVKN